MMSHGPISESMTNFSESFPVYFFLAGSTTLLMCCVDCDAVFLFCLLPIRGLDEIFEELILSFLILQNVQALKRILLFYILPLIFVYFPWLLSQSLFHLFSFLSFFFKENLSHRKMPMNSFAYLLIFCANMFMGMGKQISF